MRALLICSDNNFSYALDRLQIEKDGKFEILDRATSMGTAMELALKLKPDIAVVNDHEREFGDTLGAFRLLKDGLIETLLSLDLEKNQMWIYHCERKPFKIAEDVLAAIGAS